MRYFIHPRLFTVDGTGLRLAAIAGVGLCQTLLAHALLAQDAGGAPTFGSSRRSTLQTTPETKPAKSRPQTFSSGTFSSDEKKDSLVQAYLNAQREKTSPGESRAASNSKPKPVTSFVPKFHMPSFGGSTKKEPSQPAASPTMPAVAESMPVKKEKTPTIAHKVQRAKVTVAEQPREEENFAPIVSSSDMPRPGALGAVTSPDISIPALEMPAAKRPRAASVAKSEPTEAVRQVSSTEAPEEEAATETSVEETAEETPVPVEQSPAPKGKKPFLLRLMDIGAKPLLAPKKGSSEE